MEVIKSNKRWYAIYVKSRAEKKALAELEEKEIEAYLPLERKLKQWSDRKRWVEEPLFKGYLFVKIDLKHRFDVLTISHVVNFVKFSGKIDPVHDSQIQLIKEILDAEIPLEVTYENYAPGDTVEINKGRLRGLRGEMVEVMNKHKLLINISSIRQNILLQVNPAFVTKLPK